MCDCGIGAVCEWFGEVFECCDCCDCCECECCDCCDCFECNCECPCPCEVCVDPCNCEYLCYGLAICCCGCCINWSPQEKDEIEKNRERRRQSRIDRINNKVEFRKRRKEHPHSPVPVAHDMTKDDREVIQFHEHHLDTDARLHGAGNSEMAEMPAERMPTIAHQGPLNSYRGSGDVEMMRRGGGGGGGFPQQQQHQQQFGGPQQQQQFGGPQQQQQFGGPQQEFVPGGGGGMVMMQPQAVPPPAPGMMMLQEEQSAPIYPNLAVTGYADQPV